MKSVIIAGGTGLVGVKLVEAMSSLGYKLKILTRNPEKYKNHNYYRWDPDKKEIDNSIFPADVIINLTGEGIANSRWTKQRKKQIIDSRVNSSMFLLEATRSHQNHVDMYIGASAIGYYGNRESEILKEDSSSGDDFVSDCVRQWEAASHKWKQFSSNLSILRIGIVLSNKGGALTKLKAPLKFGIANYFGSGEQYYSWIHIDDLCKMIIHCLENQLSGTFNAVSPDSRTNKEFTKALQIVTQNFSVLMPVPSFLLKIGMGEMSQILLNSNRVSSEKIKNTGFTFDHENLEDALKSLIN